MRELISYEMSWKPYQLTLRSEVPNQNREYGSWADSICFRSLAEKLSSCQFRVQTSLLAGNNSYFLNLQLLMNFPSIKNKKLLESRTELKGQAWHLAHRIVALKPKIQKVKKSRQQKWTAPVAGIGYLPHFVWSISLDWRFWVRFFFWEGGTGRSRK